MAPGVRTEWQHTWHKRSNPTPNTPTRKSANLPKNQGLLACEIKTANQLATGAAPKEHLQTKRISAQTSANPARKETDNTLRVRSQEPKCINILEQMETCTLPTSKARPK